LNMYTTCSNMNVPSSPNSLLDVHHNDCNHNHQHYKENTDSSSNVCVLTGRVHCYTELNMKG
jgi:hypothetical protein